MRIARRLSPLELTIIGNVWKNEGCTAYSLIRHLRTSKSSYYKSSAGSVYPALKRLASAGLLVIHNGGAKDEARYSITDEGLKALRQWFYPPFEDADFMCSLDLIRSRIYFLELLAPEEREVYLGQVLTGLRALHGQVELIIEGYRREGDRFAVLAAKGALRETKARIEWIEDMAKQVRGTD